MNVETLDAGEAVWEEVGRPQSLLHGGRLARSSTPAELAAESEGGDASDGLLDLLRRLRQEEAS